ncbi:twin-arginine translocation signal domain-containing protein [bacterium]|nr:twin-arginine translocation signal domain-containing protein [bacterium]
MNETTPTPTGNLTRRGFLKSSSAAVAGATLAGLSIERLAHAASSDELKIALVGCGGRGSGAASQALMTHTLGPVKLVAMADVFEDHLKSSLENLKKQHGPLVDVPEDRQFLGFDAYKKAIALADVVILATPPGFRPMQFEEAVKQGKNIFTEKPVGTDGPGIRKFLAAADESKKKGLKVGVGLQRHHQKGYLETIKRLHDGAIGDITALRVYWNGNTPWVHPRADLEKQYGRKLTEMEYQLRNWYYFVWLCGDHINEQHIHNIDVGNWVKGKYPVRANGMGGVQVRKGKDYGEIFDHHCVEFIFDDESRMYSQCRHIIGCWNSVSEHAHGTKGRADISGYRIFGDENWRHRDNGDVNPYEQEHLDLFSAIRNNEDYNEAHNGAMSTMTALLGRMCTYSGKEITMEQALNSTVNYFPDTLAWDALPKSLPGPDGMYEVPLPGITKVL